MREHTQTHRKKEGEKQHEEKHTQKHQTLNHHLNTKHFHLPFFWGIFLGLTKAVHFTNLLDVVGAVENSPIDCIVLNEVQYR